MSNASTTPAGRMRAEDTICAIARLRALQCTMHDGHAQNEQARAISSGCGQILNRGFCSSLVSRADANAWRARVTHPPETQVVHPLAPVAAQFAARAVRYLVIGISGASFYASSGQAAFSTEDFDLFLPLDSDNRSRQA